jgi:hypothetical protein
MYTNRIKLVAIAKDEAAYLPEWIYHHLYFGIDAIDVYVNNTTDNTFEILSSIAENHDVNIINSDNIYAKSSEHFQSNAYRHAVSKTSKDIYSHILFLDVDEFWTPSDFSTSIKEFIQEKNNFDVINFNWAIHLDEDEYSQCYKEKIRMVNNSHIKYLVKTSVNFQPSIHNALGNLTYSDCFGNEVTFENPAKAKVDTNSINILPAFVLHRLYRSQKEYVSLLSRGRPRGDQIKNNRFGYYNKSTTHELTFEIDTDKLEIYNSGLAKFIKKNNLSNKLKIAREYVEKRYSNTLKIAQGQLSPEDINSLSLALRNITIPEVVNIRNKITNDLQSQKMNKTGQNKNSAYHIDAIRDAAIFYENTDLNTALELMSIAHRLRPKGTGIIKKLEEYKKKLDS